MSKTQLASAVALGAAAAALVVLLFGSSVGVAGPQSVVGTVEKR
ncbi:MAG: hypothetical protein ACHQCF_08560 [Solirubrobacterales bacterium]